MKKYLLIIVFAFIGLSAEAQNYVTIPDAHFVTFLHTNFSSCMNGNQMDTTCSEITSATFVNVDNDSIADLTGIQYFDNLTSLDCSNNLLTNLPNLPNSLVYLSCDHNLLTSLPNLPNSLVHLDCNRNQITSLPILPNSLQLLYVDNNQLTSLPSLPNQLQYFFCYANQLTSLPALPNTLVTLQSHNNNISCFPVFPNSLDGVFSILTISNNPFHCLPNYLSSMDSTTLAYPLCVTGDAINNPDNCPQMLTTGITGLQNVSTFNIAPNPFTSQTTITFQEEQNNTTIYIRDVLGNIIQQTTINGKQATIDMSGVSKGIYFVQITNEKGNMVNRKVVVE